MKGRINRILLLLAIAGFAASCGRNVVFTDSLPVPDREWATDNSASFSFNVEDTVNSNNIFLVLRTGSAYPYRNIWLFVTTTSPGGSSLSDTLMYDLADEKGNWYGKGFGDIHELKLPYRLNVFFPHIGDYHISIRHGMRNPGLKGVYDVGLRVERNIK
jgi:gliding motility-associated lipoprotein GldH